MQYFAHEHKTQPVLFSKTLETHVTREQEHYFEFALSEISELKCLWLWEWHPI